MAIVQKTNRDGIDVVVENLQQKYYAKLLNFWDVSAVYTMYPRANKNYKSDQIKPEISLDNKNYKETLYDDKVSVNSFFVAADTSTWVYENQLVRHDLSIIFQADLVKLYGDAERVDEVFNMDVLRVLKEEGMYLTGDISIVNGIDNVYSDFTLTGEFKDLIKYSDIGKRHVVKFTFEVIYKPDCQKIVGKACPNATLNINSVAPFASIESGSNLNLEVRDTLDALVGFDDSGVWRVPAGVSTVRSYVRPLPSGQSVGTPFNDYDTRWKIQNNADTYRPSAIGQPMQVERARNWRLRITNNVFLHFFRWTGTTGGYYDPDTGLYYDLNGVETTQALAFPDDLLVDHYTGILWEMVASGLDTWANHLTTNFGLTIGSFNTFYMPDRQEQLSLMDMDIALTFSQLNHLPWNFGTSNKVTSDTYLGNTSQMWYYNGIAQALPTSKLNNYRTMRMKYINPNTDL